MIGSVNSKLYTQFFQAIFMRKSYFFHRHSPFSAIKSNLAQICYGRIKGFSCITFMLQSVF
jgi:hypothetical protein